jgi:transposase
MQQEHLYGSVLSFNKFANYIARSLHRPGISSEPTEAINGRLEDSRGSALGFRKLANYITAASSGARALL